MNEHQVDILHIAGDEGEQALVVNGVLVDICPADGAGTRIQDVAAFFANLGKGVGSALVEEQGSNAYYELCEVEILPSEQTADLVSIQGLLSVSQDMHVVPLWCKRCDWRGLSSEAGWSDGSQGFEWTCPECGGAEYIRIVTPETVAPEQVRNM